MLKVMNFNIAVVDDQRRDAEKLQRSIHRYFTEEHQAFRTVYYYPDGEKFLNVFEPEKYQIIFLDIIMNSLNGIDTARRLRALDSRALIIFTTASRDYAFDAFPVHPFDYIVKPYDPQRIEYVLSEAVRVLEVPEPCMTVRVSRSTYNIPFRKISSVLSNDHTVEVIMTDGNCILCSMAFKEFEAVLLLDPRFLLCNRGVILNMDCASSLSRDKGIIIMSDGTQYSMKVRGQSKIINDFTQYQISRIRRSSRP